MSTSQPLYKVGQLVKHKRYAYRGVIVAVDSTCEAPDDWYEANQTQPDRNQPWYHVLVSDTDQTTYPAQSSLIPDESCAAIKHPLMAYFFEKFEDGRYTRNQRPWPHQQQ